MLPLIHFVGGVKLCQVSSSVTLEYFAEHTRVSSLLSDRVVGGLSDDGSRV